MYFKEIKILFFLSFAKYFLFPVVFIYCNISEFTTAIISLQPEKISFTEVQVCWQNILWFFFYLKMSLFTFTLKNISTPYIVIYWLFIDLYYFWWEDSDIYAAYLMANWVSGTKFRETTSSQKESEEETMI